MLRDIKRRGLSCPRLVVGDGHLGIWGALRNVYPQEQRCWNHKIVNVLAKLPKRQQDQAKLMLRTIPYAPTRTEAERLNGVGREALERDWDRMVTFYDFPKEHWGHLHDEPGRITLRGPQASDRCRQALQEGRSGDSGDLENAVAKSNSPIPFLHSQRDIKDKHSILEHRGLHSHLGFPVCSHGLSVCSSLTNHLKARLASTTTKPLKLSPPTGRP